MKKVIITIALVLIILAALVFANKKEYTLDNGKSTVKIGISLPMTGDLGYAGQTTKISIDMIKDKLEHQSTKYNYDLIIEDNQYETRLMSTVANKFMNADKVNAMVSFWTTPGQVMTQVNNDSKRPVPHFACAWGKAPAIGEYNFNNDPTTETYTKMILSKLREKGITNVGFIFQNAADDIEMQKAIIGELKNTEINIMFNETFNYGSKDYRTFLAKIKDKPTELIYFHLFPKDLNSLYQQMQELNMNIPLTTIDYFEELDDKRPFEGNWFITTNTSDKNFRDNWNINNPEMPLRSCVTNTYDNLEILIDAFENAEVEEGEVPTSASVLKYLKSMVTWDGVSGDLSFKESGQIDYNPSFAIIKNGKVEIEE